MEYAIFLISRPGQYVENVIVEATDETFAKSHAAHILGGDPDKYIVAQVTNFASITMFLLGGYR